MLPQSIKVYIHNSMKLTKVTMVIAKKGKAKSVVATHLLMNTELAALTIVYLQNRLSVFS